MKLKAEGIICTGCACDIEKLLRETDGILDASVNHKDDIIHIKYDQDVIDRKQVYLAARRLCGISKIISE